MIHSLSFSFIIKIRILGIIILSGEGGEGGDHHYGVHQAGIEGAGGGIILSTSTPHLP